MDAASRTALPFDSRDADSCRRTIGALPVTNVQLAWETLHALVQALRRAPPPVADYLDVLEAARAPLAFLQDETARRYASQPLPPDEGERQTFDRVVSLWRLMASAYAQVAQMGGADAAPRDRLALICQRCVHYAGRALIEHFRARRVPSPGIWLDLHGYYDTAEDWGLADESVPEPLGKGDRTATCTSAYATVLLADLANPYSRTPRELGWILEWAERFAPFAAVVAPNAEAGSRGFGIDLMQDRGTLPVDALPDRASARLFATDRVAKRLRKVLDRLKNGEPPIRLGLGKDCTAHQAGRLLVQLYRPWCQAANPRRFDRQRAHGELAMAYGFEAIHFFSAGREFVQPDHVRLYSRSEMDTLWTFRNQVDPAQPLALRSAQLGFTLDRWEIADKSMNGFRIRRGAAGPRVEHAQLIGLKPPGSEGFLLGQISWLMMEADGGLQAGIQVLPGKPQAVCLRPTGVGVSPSAKYVPAFLLPEVPVLKEPAALVMPTGWFQHNRVVEFYVDRRVTVRLDRLLAQGANFERCTFEREPG